MADSTYTYDVLLQENAALKAQLAERDACRERNRRAEEQARLNERLRRVAAESALRESEARYRTLADTMPQLVFIATASGFVEYVNRPGLEYMGMRLDEAVGFGWLGAIHPDDRQLVSEHWLECLNLGKTYEFEHRLLCANGEYRWQQARAVPIGGESGAIVRWIGTSIDIHDRRQVERDLEESRTETQELTHLHARLRALSTELNLIEQRERKRLATDLHDYLAQLLALVCMKLGHIKRLTAPAAQTEVAQTESIVNEALIYTRTLVAQLCPPVLHEFGLPLALRWLAEQMIRQELSVEVQQSVPDHLPLPEDQAVLLFQSVRELLINVRKHAKTHHAVMVVEQLDTELCIIVRDEGAGVDLAVTNTTSQPSVSSSKFGLFSIRERMLAIGGRLELESSPGQGMTARLILPLVHPPISDETARPAADRERIGERSSTGEGGRIRVLLVDDHPMIREGLRGLLYVYDDLAVVGEACNGEEALSLTDKLRPDCVIMDVNMPRMDGIEATRRLKAAFINTAVIGLSVNASREVEIAMRRAGVDEFLSKEAPVEMIYRTILATARASE